MMDRIAIFDTTLRDGEQAPGFSMNVEEKLKMARQLERLQVDIIEAGFPIASEGDFEAVKKISAEIRSVTIAGLARAVPVDIDRHGASETGDGHAADFRRDLLHGFEIAFGCDRESGFDDVHLQPLELPCHFQLLFHVHAEAGSLLPVSECCIENCDSVHHALLWFAPRIPCKKIC